jgi:hypothetical protein
LQSLANYCSQSEVSAFPVPGSYLNLNLNILSFGLLACEKSQQVPHPLLVVHQRLWLSFGIREQIPWFDRISQIPISLPMRVLKGKSPVCGMNLRA